MSERKRVAVRVYFELLHEVPSEWDEDMIRFHVEENHCLDNFVGQLADDLRDGVCRNCYRGSAQVIDYNPSPEIIERLQREGPEEERR